MGSSPSVPLGVPRHVDRGALGPPPTHRLAGGIGHGRVAAAGGEEGALLVAVHREVEHARVLREGVLDPVAVVDVPVHDEHALAAEAAPRVARGDGDRVEEAEAHRLVHLGVVPRRAHHRHPVAHRAAHHPVRQLEHRASRAPCRVQRGAVEVDRLVLRSEGLHRAELLPDGPLDAVPVAALVHQQDLLAQHQPRWHPGAVLSKPKAMELPVQLDDPLWALRVASRALVRAHPLVVHQRGLLCVQPRTDLEQEAAAPAIGGLHGEKELVGSGLLARYRQPGERRGESRRADVLDQHAPGGEGPLAREAVE